VEPDQLEEQGEKQELGMRFCEEDVEFHSGHAECEVTGVAFKVAENT
jgi:hypothetical protein